MPGVTRKELGPESQQQALLKFNNLLRNDKIINYKKQWKYVQSKSLIYSTLKTHFGLHNTLMTLSSLEIRNFGALHISYRYGACNGVIRLAINKIWKINQPSFLLFFCLDIDIEDLFIVEYT